MAINHLRHSFHTPHKIDVVWSIEYVRTHFEFIANSLKCHNNTMNVDVFFFFVLWRTHVSFYYMFVLNSNLNVELIIWWTRWPSPIQSSWLEAHTARYHTLSRSHTRDFNGSHTAAQSFVSNITVAIQLYTWPMWRSHRIACRLLNCL